MANNVNYEEMRFVIRNLVMMKILPDNGARNGTWPGNYLDLILPGNGARNSP